MLKLLFSSLVLVNAGYWMWQSWYVSPPELAYQVYAEPEINAEKMQPVAQVQDTLKRRVSRPNRAETLTDVTPPRLCYRIGPFPREKEVLDVRRWLGQRVISAVPRVVDETRMSYQVVLPQSRSLKEAETQRKNLTKLGFKDHAIMVEKGMENTVSVGVFSVKANADRRRQALAKKGVKSSVQTLKGSRSRHWLEVKSELDLKELLKKQTWSSTAASASAVDCNSEPPGAKPLNAQK